MSEPLVTIILTRAEAERYSDELSDLLCWCRGFAAALGDSNLNRLPMGVHGAREINIKIKQALG